MWWSDCHPGAARAAGAALLAAILSGCGFHLRGDVRYPPAMSVTYIEAADRYTPFYQGLKLALRDGGVRVTSDANSAGAVIRVLQDETGQRVLSVTARNTPAEFDVYYSVRYALDIAGREALPPQSLTLTRDYTYDEALVLGKSAEEETIRRSIAADLVGLVTRRLSSVE